mmetsp:Transcript_48491/g.80523  ORF Transcript_48491/g.80523 Transcript_48491/m.80523 type:complete len:92 (-) Transcript_48491:6-281(-)
MLIAAGARLAEDVVVETENQVVEVVWARDGEVGLVVACLEQMETMVEVVREVMMEVDKAEAKDLGAVARAAAQRMWRGRSIPPCDPLVVSC